MPIISKCPRCQEEVTIPDGLDPGAEVRCPLCVVVYPLRDALAEAPPALIPVDSGAIEGHGPDSDDACGPTQADAESAADEPRTLDAWQEVDAAPGTGTPASDDASPAIDTGQTPVDAEALAAFDVRESEENHAGVSESTLKTPRKKKQKGPVRFMVEVLLGGFGGLLIGYYVLCWTLWGLGSRRDIPKIPLPLLPHTMHWFERVEEADNGEGQPPAEEPDVKKRKREPQPPSQRSSRNEKEIVQPDVPSAEPPPKKPG